MLRSEIRAEFLNDDDAPGTGWTIWCDQMITRRKRYHIVARPDGSHAFRSRILLECVAYLDAENVSEYRLHWGRPDNVTISCRRTSLKE